MLTGREAAMIGVRRGPPGVALGVLVGCLVAAGAVDVATTAVGLGLGFTEVSAWASSAYAAAGAVGLALCKAAVTVWLSVAALVVPGVGGFIGWATVVATVAAAGRNLWIVLEAGWLPW